MISSRPTVPLLVHEDCMDSIKTDLADQQASLSNIATNTSLANDSLKSVLLKAQQIEMNTSDIAMNTNYIDNIALLTEKIELNTSSIKTSSSNTATQLGTIKSDTTALTSSVGTASDASTSNTVIGLLKSIANKL